MLAFADDSMGSVRKTIFLFRHTTKLPSFCSPTYFVLLSISPIDSNAIL
jgi:hypothetical protein